ALYGDGGNDLVTLTGLSTSANTFTVTGNTITFMAAALNPNVFTINLNSISTVALQGGTSGNSFTFGGPSMGVPTNIVGNGTKNTLTGPNQANVWNITGTGSSAGSGNLNGASWTFAGIQNVVGGSQTNDFVFSAGATLAGTLNGGGGGTL